jgi:transitional endoplasmic reticulum ATPase
MSLDDFVHILTGPGPMHPSPSSSRTVAEGFFHNARAERQSTEAFMVESLRAKHPGYHITVSPGYTIDLIGFAQANKQDITYIPHGETNFNLVERQFLPPARRYNDENGGAFLERIVFGCYDYIYRGTSFLVYIAEGADGATYKSSFNYVLVEQAKMDKASAQAKTDELIVAVTKYMQELHDEVLVFDQGYWQKSKELWDNIQKAKWEDVILEKEKKESIIEDVLGFFNAESRYSEFGVPWKVGENPAN